MNNFIPYGMNNGMNIPQINPYQQKLERYDNLQQQTQQIQQPTTNMNFVVVENVEKAKQQVVPFGCTIWMRDSNEPYQYIKSVNSIGSTEFHILKVEEIQEENINNDTNKNEKNEYVSLEQYNKLNETVQQLQTTVNYYSSLLNNALIPKEIDIVEEPKETKKVGRPKVEKVGE